MNNSLAEVRPELVPEWSEKNLPLKPDEITFGSNKKVWWRGACGHEWQTKVIQDALGHSDISTTLNIYADVTKEMKAEEFKGLDSYFKV